MSFNAFDEKHTALYFVMTDDGSFFAPLGLILIVDTGVVCPLIHDKTRTVKRGLLLP